jgi:rsbT co-antagonist protein RsbR
MDQLRAADERQRFFELSLDMIGIAGFDGSFRDLGRAWEQTLGFTREELLAKPFIELVHPEDRERTLSEWAAMFREAKAVSFENRCRCQDGSHVWLEWRAMAYAEESIVYFIARDVTERKQAEEVRMAIETRLRAAIDASLDLFIVVRCDRDPAGNIVDFVIEELNAGALKTVSGRREDVIGKRLCDISPALRNDANFGRFVRVVETRKPLEEETLTPKVSGGMGWVHYQVVPLGDGVAIAWRDISAQKRLEGELREAIERQKLYADELEQKNQQFTQENAERLRAEQIMQEQRETIVAMSTPIIKAWEGVLVLPVIGALEGARSTLMMERLLVEIARTRARFAVLDLTGVDMVDGATVAHLLRIVRATGLLGSRCLVSGISPSIARTMVEIGASSEGFLTFGLLEDALRYALLSTGIGRKEIAHE